jgi:hypothetical protein
MRNTPMTRRLAPAALIGIATAMIAMPAAAHRHVDRGAVVMDDSNSYWLDYKTDISEAKRELASDLRHADDESDRERAWVEYRREIADARSDFRKEMLEKGYRVGTVTVADPE